MFVISRLMAHRRRQRGKTCSLHFDTPQSARLQRSYDRDGRGILLSLDDSDFRTTHGLTHDLAGRRGYQVDNCPGFLEAGWHYACPSGDRTQPICQLQLSKSPGKLVMAYLVFEGTGHRLCVRGTGPRDVVGWHIYLHALERG